MNYEDWQPTCDTLHAHSQVLGKIATKLAAPEPQLQHSALRLTTRGIETLPLPAPDGSGALAVVLDLHRHEAVVEHTSRGEQRIALTPNRAVADVTRDVVAAVGVEIPMTPQEVPWTTPLDEDTEHATYDPEHVARYFDDATRAALVLAALRAPYRGRSTPVNFWWGSFDLAVSLFSGEPADPPSQDFIWRNAGDAQMIELGWWPGDQRYGRAAFYGYAFPPPDGFANATLAHGSWNAELGEFILDSDGAGGDEAFSFGRSVTLHACAVCGWDPGLTASVEGSPPPVV
ncbi:MAG TPA: DUF5996 family protein [Gaiellaceae bacterium]